MTTKRKFEYSDSHEFISDGDGFVFRIPPGISSKEQLLTTFAEIGNFPDYFGKNWDALTDCLRDLSWIEQKNVIIVHNDLPLKSIPTECRIYLEILELVLVDWTDLVKPDVIEPPSGWEYVDHELRIVFPLSVEQSVIDFCGV